MSDKEKFGECRICGDDAVPREELRANDGICDDCDNELAQDDPSWGAHEH
jgi:hypothetical protein